MTAGTYGRVVEAAWELASGHGRNVIVMVPTKLRRDVLDALAASDGVDAVYRTHGREEVWFKFGGRVRLASSAAALRGMTADAVLIRALDVYDRHEVYVEAAVVVNAAPLGQVVCVIDSRSEGRAESAKLDASR